MYNHVVEIYIPVALTAVANSLAKVFDHDSGGADTFGKLLLSSNGLAPASHTFCSTPAMDNLVQVINSVIGGASLSNIVTTDYANRFPGVTAPTATDCNNFWTNATIIVDGQQVHGPTISALQQIY